MKRKDFVAIAGMSTAAAALPESGSAQARNTAALANQPEAYTFFTESEVAFIETAVERLIPAGVDGPGARDAGVAFFIDQQLSGAFGTGAKTYRSGPWAIGTPMQGYQFRQTPAELYRQSIAAIDAYCIRAYAGRFASLSAARQDEVLGGLDTGTIAFESVPAKPFFELLLQNTIEGFFADPLYGGNRDKAGWQLIGFPGVAASYATKITDYNRPYKVEPVSIADVQQGSPVSAGHELMHEMATDNAAALDEANR